jgi:Flp pilus assembly protein TadD
VDLGYAEATAGHLAEARAAYEAAATLDPTFAAPCVNRAALELRAGDPAAARKWLDEALRREPGMPEALALREQLPP